MLLALSGPRGGPTIGCALMQRLWVLVAIACEGFGNDFRIAVGGCGSTTQVAFALLAHSASQVAGASSAMLRLALGRQAESFFGAFVCLLLGHGMKPSLNRTIQPPRGAFFMWETPDSTHFLRRATGGLWRIFGLFRRQNHHNPSTVHGGRLFHLGNFFKGADQAFDKLEAFVDMSILAASENDRTDHLIAGFEEFTGFVDLGQKIVLADLGSEPDFLVLAVVRMAFVLALFLLVFEFAVIHDAANRWLLGGSHFYQIEACFAGLFQGFVSTN